MSNWEVLGLRPGATPAQIKYAYRKLAMQYHPDRAAGPASEEKFKRIAAAYAALMQDSTRDDFEDFMPEYTPRRARQAKYPELVITLADAYNGAVFEYRGTRLHIAPGVDTGDIVDIAGAPVKIIVQADHTFKRSGSDLLTVVDIDAIQAILGCQLDLKHLDNSVLQYTVPAGIQHGQVVRLCAKGMPDPRTGKYGDLLIQAHIVIPTVLSEIQRAGLDKLFSRPKDVDSNEQKS